MTRRWKERLARALLAAGSLIVALLAGEIALRVLTPLPITATSNQQPHPVLRYTLDPGLPDVDEAGFRNAAPRDRYDLVAIGDSHTYGMNVARERSWPSLLARRLEASVYNLGVESYHVYSYAYLFERARRFEPRAVLVGLYPGNDLRKGVCETLALDYWKASVREGRIRNRACASAAAPRRAAPPGLLERTRGVLSRTAVGGLLERRLGAPLHAALVEAFGSEEYFELRRDGAVLRIARDRVLRHARYADRADPVVRESFEDSLRLFSEMKSAAAEEGIRLGFLLVPSKERVYYAWARKGRAELPPSYAEAIRNEIALTRRYADFFAREGLPFVDALPPVRRALEEALREGRTLYPLDDGHPRASGYAAYADAAEELLRGPRLRRPRPPRGSAGAPRRRAAHVSRPSRPPRPSPSRPGSAGS